MSGSHPAGFGSNSITAHAARGHRSAIAATSKCQPARTFATGPNNKIRKLSANYPGQLYGVAPGDFFTVTQIPKYASLLSCSNEGNGSKHRRRDCVEGAKGQKGITAPRRSGSRGCCS
jgi:hypothetical protein